MTDEQAPMTQNPEPGIQDPGPRTQDSWSKAGWLMDVVFGLIGQFNLSRVSTNPQELVGGCRATPWGSTRWP
jgi:hypothetical protein